MKEGYIFEEFLSSIPEEINKEVELSFDIADRIQSILDSRRMTQKELALKLGKKESEISKWLRGSHNFTLRTIAKLTAALQEEIVKIPGKEKTLSDTYVYMSLPYSKMTTVHTDTAMSRIQSTSRPTINIFS